MDWNWFDICMASTIVIGSVALVWAVVDGLRGRQWWHWYYNGVLGEPFPGDAPETSVEVEVVVSSSASNSAPSSSAAATQPQSTNGTGRSHTFRAPKGKRRMRLNRFARMA